MIWVTTFLPRSSEGKSDRQCEIGTRDRIEEERDEECVFNDTTSHTFSQGNAYFFRCSRDGKRCARFKRILLMLFLVVVLRYLTYNQPQEKYDLTAGEPLNEGKKSKIQRCGVVASTLKILRRRTDVLTPKCRTYSSAVLV